MMRRLAAFLVAPVFVLAGCNEDSSELAVDGRDLDGVSYSEQAPYSGKVIDGYLKNARVWLDMDGDSQYTPGPLEIELENGNMAVLQSGEPTIMSGQGGEFALDVAELDLKPEVGPDLDPRDYPLYAVALPGKTLEQTWRGDMPVARAFLMSAAPGVRNITPLTTLARYRSLFGLGSYLETPEDLAGSLAGLNLVADYVLSGDERAHAYARALARFMASQIPDEYNAKLAETGSDGTERYLSRQSAYLLGISLVQNAPSVITVVDEAAGGDYANIDVSVLSLPEVPLELSDPVLLTHQRILAQPESDQNLPVSTSSLMVSAELFFDYSEAGQLLSVSAEGCLAPSMPELVRLMSVNGLMGQLGSQWRPSVSLSPQSRIAYETEGVDERLIFDWEGQSPQIYFETSTTCHDHEGISAGSTELAGNPEVIYHWQKDQGGAFELVAEIPQEDGPDLVRTLVPKAAAEPGDFDGYVLSESGEKVASLLVGAGESCEPDAEAAGMDQVVTTQYPYQFSGYEPQPGNFVNLALEYDTRDLDGDGAPASRLLRYGFLDPALSGLANVDAGSGFQWAMYYPSTVDQVNSDLIREAYLSSYSGARTCGREFEETPSSAYAKVEYNYQMLSEYLLGLLD